MTSIRSNAASVASSLNAASSGHHAADGNATSGLGSPFAALLQQHADPDGAGSRMQATAPTPQRAAERAPERARLPEPSPAAKVSQPNGDQASKPVESSNSRPATKAADKTPHKTPDKAAARQDGSKPADAAERRADAADDRAADDAAGDGNTGKSDAASAADPLAAWLAALQGGGQAAQAAPGAPAHGAARAAAGQGGEAALQAVGEHAAALPAEARAGKADGKPDGSADFSALLAGAGRAGDAGNAPALGLAAVRMLGQGADGAALQGLGQPASGLTEAVRATGGEQAVDASAQLAALGSLGGTASAATAHGPDAPTVAAPVGSPAFAGELADQVQVLVSKAALEAAAGSVHEARLNLNPVEMGPIAIRISLDGNQAQVDFAAASGATRQALQDSMPALASALHDAGLTLSGGGVSQEFAQARQEQARQSGAGGQRSVTSIAGAAGEGSVQDVSGAVASWLRRPEGQLDLYA